MTEINEMFTGIQEMTLAQFFETWCSMSAHHCWLKTLSWSLVNVGHTYTYIAYVQVF